MELKFNETAIDILLEKERKIMELVQILESQFNSYCEVKRRKNNKQT